MPINTRDILPPYIITEDQEYDGVGSDLEAPGLAFAIPKISSELKIKECSLRSNTIPPYGVECRDQLNFRHTFPTIIQTEEDSDDDSTFTKEIEEILDFPFSRFDDSVRKESHSGGSQMDNCIGCRHVHFYEKLVSEIWERPRTAPEEFCLLYYTVHELQRMIDEYRFEMLINSKEGILTETDSNDESDEGNFII